MPRQFNLRQPINVITSVLKKSSKKHIALTEASPLQTSPLQELPEEILECIFAHISSPRCRLNVSLTCKIFLRVNEPVLYSEISFKRGFSPKKQLQIFLRRRYVCKHVRSLELPRFEMEDDHIIDECDVKLIKDLEYGNSWFYVKTQKGKPPRVSSITGIIITLCINLENLKCVMDSIDNREWARNIEHRSIHQTLPGPFGRLTRLSIDNRDVRNGLPASFIHACLLLPSMRELRVSSIESSRFLGSYPYKPSDTTSQKTAKMDGSKVEHLVLDNATLTNVEINDIVLMTRQTLKSFSLQIWMHTPRVRLDLTSLVLSLAKAAETLERLIIMWQPIHIVDSIFGELGFLSSLYNLKYLGCYKSFIVDRIENQIREYASRLPTDPASYLIPPSITSAAQILPASLETLYLDYRTIHQSRTLRPDTDKYISDLIDAKNAIPSRLPNLTTVILDSVQLEWIPADAMRDAEESGPTSFVALNSNLETLVPFEERRPLDLGVRPRGKAWVVLTDHKLRLRRMWKKAQDAGIRLRAAQPEDDVEAGLWTGTELCLDEDPFGLCEESFGISGFQYRALAMDGDDEGREIYG